MSSPTLELLSRRDVLVVGSTAVGAAAAVAAAIPLVMQMNPDASTVASGWPIELDLAPIAAGQTIKIFWRGKPIFITHRTQQEIDAARAVNWQTLPDPARDEDRVVAGHEQWLIIEAICTHLGCIPLDHQGDFGGWFCQCHGSQYDTAGRVRKGPAPRNLPLVPYAFLSDTKLRIG